jgi:Spy/CpxP family protein refolding chaperone
MMMVTVSKKKAPLGLIATVTAGILALMLGLMPAKATEPTVCQAKPACVKAMANKPPQAGECPMLAGWKKAIALTTEQEVKLAEIQQKYKPYKNMQIDMIHQAEEALQEYLHGAKANFAGSESYQATLTQKWVDLEANKVREMLEVKALLTPEQLEKSKAYWATVPKMPPKY